jgi:CBS domain-containing protein
MNKTSAHRDLLARPAADIMSHPVRSVPSGALLDDVLAAMVRSGLRHLAVVDDGGRCLGVVGDRALVAAWASDPMALARTPVRRVLDRRPSLVGVHATAGEVAREMYVDGVDAVAVIERSGQPVGMITGSDLIRLMAITQDATPEVEWAEPETESTE